MKVDKIIPCVCIDHEPNAGDSVFYGMPQLKVAGGGENQYFTPYCPNCGRGGCSEHKSAYLALKHWNKLMEICWKHEKDEHYPFSVDTYDSDFSLEEIEEQTKEHMKQLAEVCKQS